MTTTSSAHPARLVRLGTTTAVLSDELRTRLRAVETTADAYAHACDPRYRAATDGVLDEVHHAVSGLAQLGGWTAEVGLAFASADAEVHVTAPGGAPTDGEALARRTDARLAAALGTDPVLGTVPECAPSLPPPTTPPSTAERAVDLLRRLGVGQDVVDVLDSTLVGRLLRDVDRLRRFALVLGPHAVRLGRAVPLVGAGVTMWDTARRDTASPLPQRAVRAAGHALLDVGADVAGAAGGAAVGIAVGGLGGAATAAPIAPVGAAAGATTGAVVGAVVGGVVLGELATRTASRWVPGFNPVPLPPGTRHGDRLRAAVRSAGRTPAGRRRASEPRPADASGHEPGRARPSSPAADRRAASP